MNSKYDVVVFGAGISGICAALGGRRAGATVLLVEKSALTGGAITQAHVNAPAMFNAWGRQIIGGPGWELVVKTLREEGREIPDCSRLDTSDHVGSAVIVNPLLFAAICDEELLHSGVDISLHSMPVSMQKLFDGWRISIITKEGLCEISATQVIDCTGDGDVVSLAGGDFLPFEECQPGTYSFYLDGFENVDYNELGQALQVAVKRGELETGDIWWCGSELPQNPESLSGMFKYFLGRKGMNANHVSIGNPEVSGNRTKFELSGRASALRVWRFLKKQRGFENCAIHLRSVECGCRESRRIDSLQNVTVDDYRNGTKFHDAICYSFYPIDLHDDNCGLRVERIREGVIPTVPKGALIPKNSRNIMAAGRLVGSDRLANSALRIQATCMATGHAAGVLGALAAKSNCTPEAVDYHILRQNLLAQNAILPM